MTVYKWSTPDSSTLYDAVGAVQSSYKRFIGHDTLVLNKKLELQAELKRCFAELSRIRRESVIGDIDEYERVLPRFFTFDYDSKILTLNTSVTVPFIQYFLGAY